jgi:hypothetical protein
MAEPAVLNLADWPGLAAGEMPDHLKARATPRQRDEGKSGWHGHTPMIA